MADVFRRLKWAGVDVEMAPEFAKELVWEGRPEPFEPGKKNQIYIFGKQYYRISRLCGKVDVVITDSPIILSAIYDAGQTSPHFEPLILDVFNNMDNMNFFVERLKKYNPNGRRQSEVEAHLVDVQVKAFLQINDVPYKSVQGSTTGAHEIAMAIAHELHERGLIDEEVFGQL